MSETNKQLDLIVVPFHDWRKSEIEGFRTRDGHLIQHFAGHPYVNKMLVVDRPTSLAEMIYSRRGWRIKSCVDHTQVSRNAVLSRVLEKVHVLNIRSGDLLSPVRLKRDWWYHIFQTSRIIDIVKDAMSMLSMKNPVLLLWNPLSIGIIGKLNEKLLVFDAIDNWTRHPEMKDRRGLNAKGYDEVIRRAGLILVNSTSMQSFFSNAGRESLLIPNGVDKNVFNRSTQLPPDLARIPRPIAGYAGKLAKRINIELVHNLAKRFPKISFVFAGQILNRKWIHNLFTKPNIYYVGDVHYDHLPAYVSHFDVCMIPHNVGNLENDGDPIKLYEYLSAGKYVITTKIGGVEVFRDHIAIAENDDEFGNCLERFMTENLANESLIEKRKNAITDEHTWAYKADLILREISKKV